MCAATGDSLSKADPPAGYKNPVLLQSSVAVDCTAAMPRLRHTLLLRLARATETELARMVEYLKEENRVPRQRLPERITVRAPVAAPVGPAWA